MGGEDNKDENRHTNLANLQMVVDEAIDSIPMMVQEKLDSLNYEIDRQLQDVQSKFLAKLESAVNTIDQVIQKIDQIEKMPDEEAPKSTLRAMLFQMLNILEDSITTTTSQNEKQLNHKLMTLENKITNKTEEISEEISKIIGSLEDQVLKIMTRHNNPESSKPDNGCGGKTEDKDLQEYQRKKSDTINDAEHSNLEVANSNCQEQSKYPTIKTSPYKVETEEIKETHISMYRGEKEPTIRLVFGEPTNNANIESPEPNVLLVSVISERTGTQGTEMQAIIEGPQAEALSVYLNPTGGIIAIGPNPPNEASSQDELEAWTLKLPESSREKSSPGLDCEHQEISLAQHGFNASESQLKSRYNESTKENNSTKNNSVLLPQKRCYGFTELPMPHFPIPKKTKWPPITEKDLPQKPSARTD